MANSKYSSGSVALRLCARCRMTFPYNQLVQDGQVKGIWVCHDCYDHITPYSLPPLQPDAFVLRHPQPMWHPISPQFANLPEYGGPYIIGDPYIEPYGGKIPYVPLASAGPNYLAADLARQENPYSQEQSLVDEAYEPWLEE